MRLTAESDYAVRIVRYLCTLREKANAEAIAVSTHVSFRFTLKILQKLVAADIVKSCRGISGGYFLAKMPAEISVKDIVEIIEGPVSINRCLEDSHDCNLFYDKNQCSYHILCEETNRIILEKFGEVTFDKLCRSAVEENR